MTALLCAIGSVGFTHAGIGVGTFLRGASRANEYLWFGALAFLLVFVVPGMLVAVLAWDGLRRRLQRTGQLGVRWRSHYMGAGAVITGASGFVSGFDPDRWYEAGFIVPECLVAGLGTVLIFHQSKRD